MELKIPIEIVFDDVNSVIDELGKLQKYKLGEGDDMTLVDVYDVADVLTRHVMAREAKEPCGTKEGWISCSKRLPEEDGRYLVARHDYVTKTEFIDILWYEKNLWWDRRSTGYPGSWRDYAVTAWMPLPKPYGGESDD